MSRQLNIRSDEACQTARQLAEHLGKTTTDVVIEALRDYKARMLAPSAKTTREKAEADRKILKQFIAATKRNRKPGLTSDHSDLYDDDGLPI